MRFKLEINKSVQQNASTYFDKAKKMKAKQEGAAETAKRMRKELNKLDLEKDKILARHAEHEAKKRMPKKQLQWFEKFRWFRSSEGFLCVGGRDAGSNDVMVRKHADENDVVFHTEMPGSPFFVVKCEGKEPGKMTLQEAATATASFSRAWKMQISAVDTYWVKPSQLSKTAAAGEYLSKGAFVVSGKRNYSKVMLEIMVGITEEGLVMAGPPSAIRAHCEKHAKIIFGDQKPSDVAKKLARQWGADSDDILRVLPAGSMKLG